MDLRIDNGARRTARLELRPWRAEEADRLLDIVGRPQVTGWLGDPLPWTRADVDGFICSTDCNVVLDGVLQGAQSP